MKQSEINQITHKQWIIKFVTMQPKQLTAEIIRRLGGEWYQLPSGTIVLGKFLGDYSIPGCKKIDWPETPFEDYLLDTDAFPDYANNASQMINLAIEFRNQHGDPHRLNLELDENGHKRWLAIFRKNHAYAWGDSPAEALARAYLMEYEIENS